MSRTYEELAVYFANTPIELFGVYRTCLESSRIYSGHVHIPTSRCAVIIALEGAAEFVFDETERYKLKPGSVLIGGVGRRLEMASGAGGFRYCLAHYLPIETGQVKNQRKPEEISVVEAELDPELLRLVDQIANTASAPDVIGKLNQRSLFYQIVAKVLQAERYQQNADSYPMIEDAMRYMQAHFMEPLTLASLAGRYQMKPKYFSHLFTKFTGTGPIEYLIHYRMNKAHEWLLTKRFSVSAVARSVGYADPYYFSRLFKKYKGVAPSQVGFDSRDA
ncbi:helix-turn-helix transcriptional regulator [Paenibacillus athensensis]|uniref:AraC family transcriptional regulator n=1 Tax=Paenibacillus athensensis TaxID=1967502 RepID=A0A4Y8PUD8_9BACL|nr:AraC family transcriptional regulator [Paenibacillus athensensis]MCD1261693.1 helix-turn-helix transcriptional regulator [Paenibacillus athensensis]